MAEKQFEEKQKDAVLNHYAQPWAYLVCQKCGYERVVMNLYLFTTRHPTATMKDYFNDSKEGSRVCWWNCDNEDFCRSRVANLKQVGNSELYQFMKGFQYEEPVDLPF